MRTQKKQSSKSKAAASAGKRGGAKRAQNMSPAERQLHAVRMAIGRWTQHASDKDVELIRAAAAARNQGVGKFAADATIEKARAIVSALISKGPTNRG